MKPKAALHNLGCKVNEYELEIMARNLAEHGFEIVPFEPGADLYVINTCTVTNIADRKSRQMLHKAKKMNPSAIVAAVGCYVDIRKEEVKADPAIDLVLTNEEKLNISSAVLPIFTGLRPGECEDLTESICAESSDISDSEQSSDSKERHGAKDEAWLSAEDENAAGPNQIHTHTRAFIKIQDGCNQFCSYCIIPYARGPVRSRPEEEILDEIRNMAADGYKEVVLTGIHISSYGTDIENGGRRIAWRPKENAASPLLRLIEKVHGIDEIERIRLGSLEPRIMSEHFTEALSKMPKICAQFHLSLQSGCDETLRRMNRHYTTAEYAAICERIRKYFPDAAITTDIITGFPGETEEEFEQTKKFVERIDFARTHIFRYSRREGTPAAIRTDQIPEPVKVRRSDVLLKMNEEAERKFAERFLGKPVSVLFEEQRLTDGIMMWMGHTKEYLEVRLRQDETCGRDTNSGEASENVSSCSAVSCSPSLSNCNCDCKADSPSPSLANCICDCKIEEIRNGYVICSLCG